MEEELIRQVTERADVGEEQARQAVDTVLGFLKARLPEPAAGFVDAALASPQAGDALGSVVDRLGGLFGE